MSFAVERFGAVASITINQGKANAIVPEFLDALDRALDEAADASAVVLTAAGGIFSVGLDLPRLAAMSYDEVPPLMARFSDVVEKLFAFPRPVVAALNGHAVAGGFILALACDRRVVAAGESKLGLPGVSLGLVFPSIVYAVLQSTLSPRLWPEVVLSGRMFSADEACGAGIVEATSSSVLQDALALAQLLAKADGHAYGVVKTELKAPFIARARAERARCDAAFLAAMARKETRARLAEAVRRLVG